MFFVYLFLYFIAGCITSAIISIITDGDNPDFIMTMGILWFIFWLIMFGYFVYAIIRRFLLWLFTKMGLKGEEEEEEEEITEDE
jgi:phosphotransferase system  glucose/maltose/N-acetylglucosamine-specific IIC component